jgi:hypothetical protein
MSTNAQDEIDITNDINEEVYEQETTGEETSNTAEEQSAVADDGETVSISRAELDKYKREAAAAKRLRESRGKVSEKSTESTEYDQDLIERTFLAAQASIIDPEVQDEAIRLARKFGMPITQAVKDVDISMRLRSMQEQRKAQRSVAKGTSGSTTQARGVEWYAKQYKEKGILPEDRKMVSKILDYLAD